MTHIQRQAGLQLKNYLTEGFAIKYLTSLYWTMVTITTVGYGDIVPITPLERIITILVIIIGSGIFAVYSSALANLFSDLVKKDIIQKGKLENFEKCGEIYNFSREL